MWFPAAGSGWLGVLLSGLVGAMVGAVLGSVLSIHLAERRGRLNQVRELFIRIRRNTTDFLRCYKRHFAAGPSRYSPAPGEGGLQGAQAGQAAPHEACGEWEAIGRLLDDDVYALELVLRDRSAKLKQLLLELREMIDRAEGGKEAAMDKLGHDVYGELDKIWTELNGW